MILKYITIEALIEYIILDIKLFSYCRPEHDI